MSFGKKVYWLEIVVKVKLGAKGGELELRTTHKGVQVGMATIDFSHS